MRFSRPTALGYRMIRAVPIRGQSTTRSWRHRARSGMACKLRAGSHHDAAISGRRDSWPVAPTLLLFSTSRPVVAGAFARVVTRLSVQCASLFDYERTRPFPRLAIKVQHRVHRQPAQGRGHRRAAIVGHSLDAQGVGKYLSTMRRRCGPRRIRGGQPRSGSASATTMGFCDALAAGGTSAWPANPIGSNPWPLMAPRRVLGRRAAGR